MTEHTSGPSTRVCVIDLGTNSVHTLIVDTFPDGKFEVLDRTKEMVTLGEGGLIEHRLTERAMERTVRAIERVKLLADAWNAREYLAFGTSAIREATNGADFIDRIHRDTGIQVRVIDGDLEANLIYQGVRHAVDMHEPTLMVDIGGGSTEFIIGTSRDVCYATSLKLGAARMTEQFIEGNPVGREASEALAKHYRDFMRPVLEACTSHRVRELVGSSGTFENVAQVSLHLCGKADRSIYHEVLRSADILAATQAIMAATTEQRRRMPGIDEKRVGQIFAGAKLVDMLLKELPFERIRISPNALREGMVVYFIGRGKSDQGSPHPPEVER